jgi:hypothetical protein
MPDSKNSDSTNGADTRDRGQEHACIRLLLERFPHLRAISIHLLERHETFRELCEEYEACTEVIERLAHSQSDDALTKEYSALRLRLEGELLRYISEHWSSNEPR